ncbi:daptomycin-sensing surface protein LiaX [Lactobacillus sp. CC-MHH1034]|uniref:daptomycin-sensing surface protein LiaX n=1 Tax=Agrilactobacillus fermenti TaxID=2586909 RepID=UPI001E5AC14D|nr:daptomycin-sensing surface protein LiaX [Agrilactobacillus fermenti]MCD2256841.1 daptomycin-sensing surface protein LiaX [Agrilactobacillus fermenti]
MNERQRILDLVKKGIISSEEALVLLENLEKNGTTVTDTTVDHDQTAETTDTDQATDDTQAQHLADLRLKRAQLKDSLNSIDHQIKAANEQITVLDTMEDLEGLAEDKANERTDLKQKVNDLTATRAEVQKQKQALDSQIEDLKADEHAKSASSFDTLSDDWKDTARNTFSDLTQKLTEAGNQVGSFVKESVGSLMDNVDWKDINMKVPGLATSEFEHQFLYEDNQAKLVDLKLANGSIKLEPSENDNIAVNAKIKLFGHMSEDTPFEAFMNRVNIDVSNDRFVFQVPNKRIKADLTVYLPKRDYERISVKMLNGNLDVSNISSSDFYAKTANGNLRFSQSQLSYLEAENVNGHVIIENGSVTDSVLATVNGNVVVAADIHSGQFNTVNGEVRGTITGQTLHKFVANSVNGNVKLAVDPDLALSVKAKTRFGSIKNRIEKIELVDNQANDKQTNFTRGTQDDPASIELSTTAGNILLKDNANA